MKHRADIQGLRGVAVLLVVLAHAGVGPLRGGFVGVDVFFVLSGFLITGILLAEADRRGSISLVGFYVRRARRILPAAALTLVATVLAASALLNVVRAREAVADSLYAAAFAANIRFADRQTDYFAADEPPSPVLHFWSLAVEEQFYLVWPALVCGALAAATVLGARRRPVLLAVVVALTLGSLAWSLHLTAAAPRAAYFSAPARAWELGLGASLAVVAPALARLPRPVPFVLGWTGVLAIAVAALTFSEATAFPGYAALLPTLGTAFVLAAGAAPSRASADRLLALRPLRAVGDRSYALYLWHWPVLILAAQYAGRELPLAANLGLVAGAFALSALSYATVENPIRRAKWRPATTAAVLAALAATVVGVAAVSLGATAADQRRLAAGAVPEPPIAVRAVPVATVAPAERALPEVVAAVRAARRNAPIPARLTPAIATVRDEPLPYSLPKGCVPVAASDQSSSEICRLGRTASRRALVLVGDSHAQMWLPAVVRMAKRDGLVVIPLLRPGCTPDTWVGERGPPACRPWFRWATAQVRRLRPDLVLVGGAMARRGRTQWEAVRGLLALARAAAPAAERTFVVGDPEALRRNAVDCLLSRGATMRTCTAVWPAAHLRPYDRLAGRAAELGFGFVDTRGWFCFERRCPAVIGRTIVYRDFSHVTAAYALRLAGVLRASLRPAARAR